MNRPQWKIRYEEADNGFIFPAGATCSDGRFLDMSGIEKALTHLQKIATSPFLSSEANETYAEEGLNNAT